MYDFEFEGNPVSWKAHGGYGRRSFNPRQKERENYQVHIKKVYKNNLPLTVAVKFEYFFYFPIPKSTSKAERFRMLMGRVNHIKRPDLSNCVKFVEDCFKEIVIKDDSQVMVIYARKEYSEFPRTNVRISLA